MYQKHSGTVVLNEGNQSWISWCVWKITKKVGPANSETWSQPKHVYTQNMSMITKTCGTGLSNRSITILMGPRKFAWKWPVSILVSQELQTIITWECIHKARTLGLPSQMWPLPNRKWTHAAEGTRTQPLHLLSQLGPVPYRHLQLQVRLSRTPYPTPAAWHVFRQSANTEDTHAKFEETEPSPHSLNFAKGLQMFANLARLIYEDSGHKCSIHKLEHFTPSRDLWRNWPQLRRYVWQGWEPGKRGHQCPCVDTSGSRGSGGLAPLIYTQDFFKIMQLSGNLTKILDPPLVDVRILSPTCVQVTPHPIWHHEDIQQVRSTFNFAVDRKISTAFDLSPPPQTTQNAHVQITSQISHYTFQLHLSKGNWCQTFCHIFVWSLPNLAAVSTRLDTAHK